MNTSPISYSESLRVGTTVYISPDQIDVQLEIEAPGSVSLNTGVPRSFPRVNSYVLVPCDEGFVVGQIEWLTIEHSPYPKRKGLQDFGVIDLPFPLRKMRLNPLGTLKAEQDDRDSNIRFKFRRGVDAFPSVGDPAFLPTDNQLHAIIESGENRRVQIGTSPLAGRTRVMVDPDRLFGRHLAVLGNTGSGKSCSVAGLIRWSLEAACKSVGTGYNPNARFIVLDPNGEYTRAFHDVEGARFYSVDPSESIEKLHVPLWFWNSTEWCTFTKASPGAQKPAIHKALRLRRNAQMGPPGEAENYDLINYLKGAFATVCNAIETHAAFSTTPYVKFIGFLENLDSMSKSLSSLNDQYNPDLSGLIETINELHDVKCKNSSGYNKALEYKDVRELADMLAEELRKLGEDTKYKLKINEDVPIKFASDDFVADLTYMATNSNNPQWFDSLLSRVNSLLADTRMKSIVEGDQNISLDKWLDKYIGCLSGDDGPLTVIDLSLVPSEIIHVITAVIARISFDALQRYRKHQTDHSTLPTVIVMEEAHTFIKRYTEESENASSAAICCQVFERIAREGRKFGLGLILSSQRPSELSPTVLSQCNTFLLHRISNDRDQDLVNKLVPDNLKGLLRDLPTLPSQNAILLGWASEIPTLVKMNHLPKEFQPQSDDPAFWNTWTSIVRDGGRTWKDIVEDWTKPERESIDTIYNDDEPEQTRESTESFGGDIPF